ncbi:MAG TPA: DUF4097 family beta strand repeat-containing protein [Gaiellaceae bacterium]|jgi:DUF4097 and DUF4098 domain-containing protein YvlB
MPIEKTFTTPGEPRLRLAIPAGSITVETVDGEETHVVVDCDNEQALEDVRVELRGGPNDPEIVVETERKPGILGAIDISIGNFSMGSRSTFAVSVRAPHGSRLRTKTASAQVRARGRYSEAEIQTVSGDLSLDEVEREATVRTTSGDVRVERVGGSLRLQTVSGDGQVGSVGGPLTVQTVSGDVTVREAHDAVTTKTVSGDQRFGVEQGEVRATSVSGDIEIGIRSGSRLDVDASSVSGDMRSELELGDTPTEGNGPVVVVRGKTVSGDFRVVRA